MGRSLFLQTVAQLMTIIDKGMTLCAGGMGQLQSLAFFSFFLLKLTGFLSLVDWSLIQSVGSASPPLRSPLVFLLKP